MKKKWIASLLVVGMLSSMIFGCSSTDSSSTSTDAETESEVAEATEDVEQTVIEFWYHDGNEVSNVIYEEIIANFEAEYPQYTVNYVGLPSDSYLTKYNTAIATGTVPDVISVRDTDVTSFINQGALMVMDDVLAEFDEGEYISEAVLEAMRKCSVDGLIYSLPTYITSDIAWVNTAAFEEAGIEAPETIDEFLAYCEEFANESEGTYFYSLRGGAGSAENLFDFLFTYAGQSDFFDADGVCVLDQDIFAEAFDAYASIYWNGWTSKDSVTNAYQQMVAEFGSGVSMYISHNSSSLSEHQTNLGEGNFINIYAPANSDGTIVTKDLSFMGFGIPTDAENTEGAIEFVKYLASHEAASLVGEEEGRIPVNSLVYEDEWFVENEYMQVYVEYMADENVEFITHPVWLSGWSEFKTNYQEPDLQAVLLQEKTSEEVLATWAEYLTTINLEYLSSLE